MSAKVLEAFATGNYKKVVVIYQNFISTFEQTPVVRQVLPVITDEVNDLMRGIKPKTGKFSSDRVEADVFAPYNVEPSPEEVLDTLLPQLVQACEHSARMVAMKNATDKSKEMIKALTIKFNNKRQAAITAEVSEITAGVESMK
jgi:F-type H+-transporting ATPase subunit gamma